jgi:hypothetical protein
MLSTSPLTQGNSKESPLPFWAHKGRADTEAHCITRKTRSFPLSLIPSPQGEGNFLAR